ncbi:MAG: Fe-S cluster assembly protein NifU [Deltaproteobacteria bacterium]|nr:Fe-S cluster assembly protein NifU [Deltaproteobacteria bacterium]
MWEYSDKVIDHFLHPRNVGELENPDGEALVGNIACGDALKLTFKLDENGKIVDARFKTFGCASAIASASAMTEMVKGMTIEEAAKITDEDIANYLGGLPKEKIHCSVMGREALEKAIAHYKGETVPGLEGEVICECFGVTRPEIERVVRDHGLKTVEEVTNYTKAGGGCGGCVDKIQEIIDQVRAEGAPAAPRPKLTNLQKIRLIEETIQREIRPALQHDGGDLELVDVVGNRVLVSTRGACASCAAAQITLKDFVEAKLKELVAPELQVEEVAA